MVLIFEDLFYLNLFISLIVMIKKIIYLILFFDIFFYFGDDIRCIDLIKCCINIKVM